MNLDVSYMSHLGKERKRIIEELGAHGIVFTLLTEQEISVLRFENVVVVSNDWLKSPVNTQQQ